MNSLPLQIFNDVGQPQDRLVERAWGAALTLVLMSSSSRSSPVWPSEGAASHDDPDVHRAA